MLTRSIFRFTGSPRPKYLKFKVQVFFTVHQRHKWMLPQLLQDNYSHDSLSKKQAQDVGIRETMVEIKHYLRTRELPNETRMNILRPKLERLVESSIHGETSKEYFETINAGFMYFYLKTKKIDSCLRMHKVYELFNKTAQFFIDSNQTDLPHYMGVLASKFMKEGAALPTSVLVNMAIIGSRARFGGLSMSLSYILRSSQVIINDDFTSSLLEHQAKVGKLDMDTFEAFLTYERMTSENVLINDDFIEAFISHIQYTFANTTPKTHEYLDTSRSILRIQYVMNLMIEQYLKVSSPAMLLKLLKLKADLNSVSASTSDKNAVDDILLQIQANGDHKKYSRLKQVLLMENIDDEDAAECLLIQLSIGSNSQNALLLELCEFFVANKMSFSPSLRLKAHLLSIASTHTDQPYDKVLKHVKEIYDPYLLDSNTPSTVLTDTLRMASTFKVQNIQSLLDNICKDIIEQRPEAEMSIAEYKIMIDRAIASKENKLAYSLFEKSLTIPNVHWLESLDPTIAYTLDRLVISSFQTNESITESFSRFKRIKQHMSSSCSAEALCVISEKMLAEACVGDVIELLTRELPKIKKDSYDKLRLDLPFCEPYKKLFNQLHKFVITYREDPSFETNWVFYGELHKYFHVSFETYLPVIKFFCEADRLNAALLIVRRMKMLSELHAETNINQPPSRDIYIYLLKVFGDKLYEEGVIEVHEYLKMDTSIETQDIHMQNCILGAYSNLQNVGKARDLFLTISSNSKQHGGINEETAQIMIKTYTYSGLPYVKHFWNSLSQYDIFPDYAIYRQYLIAHTYHGQIEEAIHLIETIDDYNLELSADLMISMYNYCLEPEKQKQISKWASEHHKEIWKKIQRSGLLKNSTSFMPDNNLIASGSE